MSAGYQLLNVFAARDGSFGNPLGVFVDGAAIPAEQRQAVAAELGYSETVFVDDVAAARLRIVTPAAELPLAGHPLVGTAWLLDERFGSCDMLRPPAGEVATWQEGELRWIRTRPEWAPELEIRQGRGSLIHVKPAPDGMVDVGGRVVDRGELAYGD